MPQEKLGTMKASTDYLQK